MNIANMLIQTQQYRKSQNAKYALKAEMSTKKYRSMTLWNFGIFCQLAA